MTKNKLQNNVDSIRENCKEENLKEYLKSSYIFKNPKSEKEIDELVEIIQDYSEFIIGEILYK